MKLTPTFKQILKGFTTINQNMYFVPGKVQSTIGVNSGKSVTFFARAITDVDIPEAFGISNLSKFLSVLSLFKDPDINFSRSTLNISEGTTKEVFITLSQPDFISYEKKPERFKVSGGYESLLTNEVLSDINKMKALLKATHIIFKGNGKVMNVTVTSIDNSSADSGSIILGDCEAKFKAVLQTTNFFVDDSFKENFKVIVKKMDDDKGFVYLGNGTLEYYIPCEPKLSNF